MSIGYINGEFAEVRKSEEIDEPFFSGVFETIRFKQGTVEYLEEHLQRLTVGCRQVGIVPPSFNAELVIRTLLQRLRLTDEVCRIRIFCAEVEHLISAEAYQPLPMELYQRGMALDLQLHPNPSAAAQVKRVDRAGYAEAFEQAKERGFDECLFYQGEELLECSSANIIVVDGDAVKIPSRAAHRLAGVMEQNVLRCLDVPVQETVLCWPLPPSVRVYLTSSMRGLLPVRRIADRAFDVDPADPLYQLISQFWPYP